MASLTSHSNASAITGTTLVEWVRRAVRELHARRVEINALNVFPVPDADTGSNLAHTMDAALQAIEQLPVAEQASTKAVAAALALGSAKGARGNSGVVLSQVLRGIAQHLDGAEADGALIQRSLRTGYDYVMKALTEPVEGTVVTVLRSAAIAAEQDPRESMIDVLTSATEAARTALAHTPSQLPVLREAGVVDAGGRGLVILLETLLAQLQDQQALRPAHHVGITDLGSLVGATIVGQQRVPARESFGHPMNLAQLAKVYDDASTHDDTSAPAPEHSAPITTSAAMTTDYEAAATTALSVDTEATLAKCGSADAQVCAHTQPCHEHESHTSDRRDYLEVMFFIADADLDALRTQLQHLGDSLIVAEVMPGAATVHIHSHQAATVIETAYANGSVTDLRLEILPAAEEHVIPQGRTIIAVTPPGSLAKLYQQAGATVVAYDPAQTHDVVLDVVTAARETHAAEIILLPNGMLTRSELASVERSTQAFDQSVTILPTGCLVNGLAAIAVHDEQQSLAVDAYAMSEAVSAMRYARIIPAQKARLTHAGPCAKDDVLVITHEEVIAVTDSVLTACIQCVRALFKPGDEQITVLLDPDYVTDIQSEQIAAGLPPHVQVDISIYPATQLGSFAEIGVE
ncbi:DAK2 domain-containing protein [Corynebacterium sp. HS2168-gen11]|uniref:DAK2 domain-containing protein n=1 Tax=Corynebacterium sp. HS2168-gen11 TaxID=2974027 RepID=UPI00216ADC9E|nr:DAK2 domain-containing protein [Corynebacterium sp. HS2168-gen11]MCS4534798.1 DAK2 domain-containing protein [Corynebacterium sp. HS2168-gen11]